MMETGSTVRVLCKGAPEVGIVGEIVWQTREKHHEAAKSNWRVLVHAQALSQLMVDVPSNYDEAASFFGACGLRVLALAWKAGRRTAVRELCLLLAQLFQLHQ